MRSGLVPEDGGSLRPTILYRRLYQEYISLDATTDADHPEVPTDFQGFQWLSSRYSWLVAHIEAASAILYLLPSVASFVKHLTIP